MEAFSLSLIICTGNSPVTGEFPTKKPVTRIFDVFFGLRLNKWLSEQWWGWWFETPLRPLWLTVTKGQLKWWSWQLLGFSLSTHPMADQWHGRRSAQKISHSLAWIMQRHLPAKFSCTRGDVTTRILTREVFNCYWMPRLEILSTCQNNCALVNFYGKMTVSAQWVHMVVGNFRSVCLHWPGKARQNLAYDFWVVFHQLLYTRKQLSRAIQFF